jgi:hypothetical protein
MAQGNALVKELQTVDVAPVEGAAAMFERLARDPDASVEKIERLMALWERGEARKSEGAFNVAMSAAQAAMRPIATDADNPQTRSRYASYAALDRGLRPIYTQYGFGLSFDTADSPIDLHVRVLCYVTHADGFSRTYHIDMPADGKGAKGGDVMTRTHATGSAVSYGMRYLLKMIFNVAVGEHDDDGNRASGNGGTTQRSSSSATPPPGFDEWWTDMRSAADTGWSVLDKAWAESKGAFKQYVHEQKRGEWQALKAKAQTVKA